MNDELRIEDLELDAIEAERDLEEMNLFVAVIDAAITETLN